MSGTAQQWLQRLLVRYWAWREPVAPAPGGPVDAEQASDNVMRCMSLVMPLLVLWTSGVALFGGMVSAWVELDLSFGYFLQSLAAVVPIANLYIALAKGACFGLLIALIACHFGLRVEPNTESLSANTTASVVSSITIVILVDAIFAIATRTIGIPQ